MLALTHQHREVPDEAVSSYGEGKEQVKDSWLYPMSLHLGRREVKGDKLWITREYCNVQISLLLLLLYMIYTYNG